MSKQVLDVQQMQHLQELGVDTSNASMLYCEMYDEEPLLVESKHRFDKEENAICLCGIRNSVVYCKSVIPVYTLQDVLDLLPKSIGVEYIYDLCIFPESISYTQFMGGESKHRFDKEENAICLCGIRNSVVYCKSVIPVYTLQDVLDLLPKSIGVEYIYDLCIFPESISYTQFMGGEINDNLFAVPINESLIDAAYSMLCWAIENKFVETNKNNK